MDVGSGRASRRSDPRDRLSRADLLAFAHEKRRVVGVKRRSPLIVAYYDDIPVSAQGVAREQDLAVRRSVNRIAGVGRDVDPLVLAAPALAELGTDHAVAQGPQPESLVGPDLERPKPRGEGGVPSVLSYRGNRFEHPRLAEDLQDVLLPVRAAILELFEFGRSFEVPVPGRRPLRRREDGEREEKNGQGNGLGAHFSNRVRGRDATVKMSYNRAMTERLDCRALAKRYRDWILERAALLPFTPSLATVLVKNRVDAGSLQYRDMIVKDAAKLGFDCRSVEASGEAELIERIEALNADVSVHGIVVLYPLGLMRSDEDIMDLVTPRKDVEGLHSINLGYLIKYRRYLDRDAGLKCVVPATAKAVVKGLQAHPVIGIDGAFVTIVNNSMRVGKPLGLMLENLGATVIKCYDRTRPEILESSVRRSDIVVTAVPDPSFRLNPEWIRDGAAVVDVSYQGNVDVRALDGRAGLVTMPDNRIGRVTRAMMFVNLMYSCGPQPSFDPRAAAVR